MPSGLQILQRLRTNPVADRIAVVVISNSVPPPEGACASLREPFDLGVLAATLSSVRVRAAR